MFKRRRQIEGETFDMYLGLPGSCKTLAMTEQVVLPALLRGEDVYCSYWVNWNKPNFHYWRDFSEVSHLRNALVVFDEIGNILNPRNWDSEDGEVRDFFMLHRHRYIDICSNTQHLSLIAKTALIQVTRFYMFDRMMNGDLLHFIFGEFPYVVSRIDQLTLNQFKLLDMGIILKSDDEENEMFRPISRERVWFKKTKLVHRELNEYKTEILHRYCEKCCHRQGSIIERSETKNFLEKIKGYYYLKEGLDLGKCPKHKIPLEMRETGMYDSHYEPERKEQGIIFKPFKMSKKMLPFRGSLSIKEVEQRQEMEASAR